MPVCGTPYKANMADKGVSIALHNANRSNKVFGDTQWRWKLSFSWEPSLPVSSLFTQTCTNKPFKRWRSRRNMEEISQLDVTWSVCFLSICIGEAAVVTVLWDVKLAFDAKPRKDHNIFSWFYFKSMTSMHVQTAEEVGDVCKLLSSVTKYSGKYIYTHTYIYI